MNVLIIDDHEAFRDEVRRILQQHGHSVADAVSAPDAIPLAETGNYDIILLDYQMPDNDGLWFLKNARIPRCTKVLLVTSHTEPRLINEILHAGAAGYLIKPFEEDDLLRNVAYYTSDRALPRADTGSTAVEDVRNHAAANRGSADGGAPGERLR